MTVRDIAAAIEAFAPLSVQEDWDNSGLCIGSPDQPVHGVLVGFDCTPQLVDEAVALGADMIVTHHPLIFHGLRTLSPDDHTHADKVPEGVSGAMARRLGLRSVRVLDPDAGGQTGLGAVGTLPAPMDAARFLAHVKSVFGLQVLRCSAPVDVPVSCVAVCGGSGSSLIGKARSAGAQAYLCGDVSYHHFFTSKDFMVIDIGHFEGEVDIVDILFTLIRKKFPTFAVHASSALAAGNPVHYFI